MPQRLQERMLPPRLVGNVKDRIAGHNARDLVQNRLGMARTREMPEHPNRDHPLEGTLTEREGRSVCLDRRGKSSLGSELSEHGSRGVHRYDPGIPPYKLRCDAPCSAANLHDRGRPARVNLCESARLGIVLVSVEVAFEA